MKKSFKLATFIILCLAFIFQSFVFASAKESIDVYVSIPDGSDLALAADKFTLSDVDNDGKITINDALIVAHEEKLPDGYAYSQGPYGLRIDKLWGVENGDGYGYYLNNQMAMSLGDELKNGDHVYAFSYVDTEYFSDVYTFFSDFKEEAFAGDEITLTLYALTFDESWNLVTYPVENATIMLDCETTDIVTDKDGKFKLKLTGEENLIISAECKDKIITPPVCVVNVKAKDDIANPGEASSFAFVILLVLSLSGIIFSLKRVRNNEI